MRISYILDTFGGGGKERRCLQIMQGLNSEGVTDIQVVIINNDVTYKELYETSAMVEIIDRKNRRLSQTQTAKELYRLLKGFRPDIVQAWGIMSAGVVLMVKPFIKFRFYVSYVADVITPKGVSGVINRWCGLACDKIISNSKAGLVAYKTPKSKGVLIYNGFNESRYCNKVDRVMMRSELCINTHFVVAMLASFGDNKDWQCYIETAKQIIKVRKDITFLAIGDGPQFEYYNNLITNSERELIVMLGRRDDVDELLQICDLTVLTSKYGEGLSNSVLESMAWGVPVIASEGGGTPEIIENNVNGILIDEQTPEHVSRLITNLLNHPTTLAQMSDKAKQTIQDGFLLHRMTEEYLKLYKEG